MWKSTDTGQWEGQFYSQGKHKQSNAGAQTWGYQEDNSAMTHVQQQTPLEQQWKVKCMAKGDLRHLCVGIWIAPGAFCLPHFLPSDAALVTAQPLGAALERKDAGCWSTNPQVAFLGNHPLLEKNNFPATVSWTGIELPDMFKCRLWLAVARGVIRTKPSKQQLFLLLLYSFISWLWLLIEVFAWLWSHQTQHQICHWLYYETRGVQRNLKC